MIDCICVRKNPVIFEIKKNFYNMETKQSLLTLTKELKFIPVIPFMRQISLFKAGLWREISIRPHLRPCEHAKV